MFFTISFSNRTAIHVPVRVRPNCITEGLAQVTEYFLFCRTSASSFLRGRSVLFLTVSRLIDKKAAPATSSVSLGSTDRQKIPTGMCHFMSPRRPAPTCPPASPSNCPSRWRPGPPRRRPPLVSAVRLRLSWPYTQRAESGHRRRLVARSSSSNPLCLCRRVASLRRRAASEYSASLSSAE